jgi:hypothetical protein
VSDQTRREHREILCARVAHSAGYDGRSAPPVEVAMKPCRRLSVVCGCAVVGSLITSLALPDSTWTKPVALDSSWTLDAPQGTERWLAIHAVPTEQDSSFHVEVMEAAIGDPPWKFHWLAPHMAISEDALRRSIRGPSRRRADYPETYESAYRSWLVASAAGAAKTCTTAVAQCL